MNPGATIRPRASKVLSAVLWILFGTETSATRPSRSSTSMSASTFAAGSITRPPLIKSEAGFDLSCAICCFLFPRTKKTAKRLFFRPAGALFVCCSSHGLRRGLHSIAASRLKPEAPDALARLAERLGQDRHSHRHSVTHLFNDHRLWAIRDFPCQFQPANDGAGMHQDCIALGHF